MKTSVTKFGIAVFLSAFLNINLIGQTLDEAKSALKNVKSLRQLDELKRKYPNMNISEEITMLSDSAWFPEIINAKIGDIVLKQYNDNAPKYVMKILKIDQEELCRAKYIYLNGSKYSNSEIDSIRSLIMTRLNNGEDFTSLVNEYTMDNNPTGDLGWFHKGTLVEDFDNAVRRRTKGEIFTVDVDSKKWYYVVFKTHDNKVEKAIKALKIMYSI
jgi:parvulin-like peptidyl-prolyl isomerase